jgi:hypothetical protein
MPSAMPSDTDKPYRGRRITWAEFHRLRPVLRLANDNDNEPRTTQADSATPEGRTASDSRCLPLDTGQP